MHKLEFIKAKLATVPKRYWLAGAVVVTILLYGFIFRERTLAFSYAGESCDRQLVLLPGLTRQTGSSDYELELSGGLKLGSTQLWTTKVCASPQKAPTPGEVVASIAPFGGVIGRLSYKVEAPQLPKVDDSVLDQPIAASRPLKVKLSEVDETFSYAFKAEDKIASCGAEGASLSCDVPKLELKQGAKYDIALERQFKGKPVGAASKARVETLSPVTITAASVDAGATVYDKPREFVVETDKPLHVVEFNLQKLGDQPTDLAVSSSVDGKRAVVSLPEDLPREADFKLVATRFEAKDGSTPLDEYELSFKTSGGPKVANVNIGTTGVALNSEVVISFDQELSANQDLSKLVTVEGVPATVARQGGQLFIRLSDTPKCTDFIIKIGKGLLSKHEIPSTSAWQRSQRTICHTVSVVGYSAAGRAITAYEFGSGPRTILFVGAIHGNEVSTYSLMTRWISELEARAREIPADKKVVVVPQINPDGVARGSRVNSRNVDLNRNFSTSDWQKDITTVGNQAFLGGGGESPLSEPESKAMAALASRLRPELTLSYHSIGGLLAANQAGRSNSLASTYSSLSGYRNTTGQTSTTFEYSISGTWDDYLAERLGLASILIELGSHSYHQFERNQAAMWAMVRS